MDEGNEMLRLASLTDEEFAQYISDSEERRMEDARSLYKELFGEEPKW